MVAIPDDLLQKDIFFLKVLFFEGIFGDLMYAECESGNIAVH